MSIKPLHQQSICELAAGLRNGEFSSADLTQHFLARIGQLEPSLNAYRLVCSEQALAEARAADDALRCDSSQGPLHGIPFAVKDLFDVAGLPTSAGASFLAGNIAKEDSAPVKRLREQGMVLLGKLNMVQLAYGGVGINHDQGTPHNPWHHDPYIPGGSSSGSGVAVAAGLAPVALGSDTGGSVRLPASFCGVTGLKTTVGQISRAGVFPLSWTLDSVGPLARAAEDAAYLYQAMQGVDDHDPTTGPGTMLFRISVTVSVGCDLPLQRVRCSTRPRMKSSEWCESVAMFLGILVRRSFPSIFPVLLLLNVPGVLAW